MLLEESEPKFPNSSDYTVSKIVKLKMLAIRSLL